MDLFPYTPRKNQEKIMRDISDTLLKGKDFVFESGTGSGKTICALCSTLEFALEKGKKIVYTTRTNAQQRQVIIELREIRKRREVFGVGIQGRANMCILARKDPEIGKGTADELSKYCSNQKKMAKRSREEGCEYFRNIREKRVEKISKWARKNLPTAEEFIISCEESKLCPYEINKLLISSAEVVVVPYIYIFDPSIRASLFEWLSVPEKDIILIVDEAHNLPDYLRELFSTQLSIFALNKCIAEAKEFEDPEVGKERASEFCKTLSQIIFDLRDTYVYGVLENGIRRNVKEDALIPSHELESEILSRLRITSLSEIISDLILYGEKIQEHKQKEGKLPRSYIHRLGSFLEFWTNVEMDQYIKLVVDNGRNPRIEVYCLDPSIGTKILGKFHSSIHMSGTLKPLEEYRDSLGLPIDTKLVFYPSPFSKENRKVFYTRDVTTRYEEISDKRIASRMWEYITSICNNIHKNTMVFFPSFNILSMFKKSFKDIRRRLYVEEQSMSQTDLMELVKAFKSKKGSAFFSVMGGRISEGMDFPAEQLEIAVIVGIPYPKPTARQKGLQKYYDLKFGKGWEYAVRAPAARKLLQSIGRLIRNENDRGVAVILDKRAPRFKQYIDMKESKDLLRDITEFLIK